VVPKKKALPSKNIAVNRYLVTFDQIFAEKTVAAGNVEGVTIVSLPSPGGYCSPRDDEGVHWLVSILPLTGLPSLNIIWICS